MPQDVRLVIARMGDRRSGFALTSSVGAVVTAHEELRWDVTPLSAASNKQPDGTCPLEPPEVTLIFEKIPGEKIVSKSGPMLYLRICSSIEP
jgi:hypothetical protein